MLVGDRYWDYTRCYADADDYGARDGSAAAAVDVAEAVGSGAEAVGAVGVVEYKADVVEDADVVADTDQTALMSEAYQAWLESWELLQEAAAAACGHQQTGPSHG